METVAAIEPTPAIRAIDLQVLGMSKRFGSLNALEDVSIHIPAGSFHALLGENGAGKSTFVKCITGFHRPDRGQLMVNNREVAVGNPRAARDLGIGMVYQNFALVPSLTGTENLVISRGDTPSVIRWDQERARLAAVLERMPFKVPLEVPVWQLAAGEKQKLEILKQLYLDQRFLILDEPTSVMTPDEADEMLGLLQAMAGRGDITVLMISHKFREVRAFADSVSVLRRGRLVGAGKVSELSNDDMARMMIGELALPARSARIAHPDAPVTFEIAGVTADQDDGTKALDGIALELHAGEIVGIAGVSGNGQTALVEVLSGQRAITGGALRLGGKPFRPTREAMLEGHLFCLPEEPLKNTAVPGMSVAENMAFRTFDRPPIAKAGGWLSIGAMRRQATELVSLYRVRAPSLDAPIANLSGGNVQRTVLAREISGDVRVLIVANPCAGLDFVSVADIRAKIMDQRNRGAAVLLLSEDLDEILELSDRIAVMSGGRITYLADAATSDRTVIGRHMGGH